MANNLAQERILKTRQLVLEYLATHSISDKLNRFVNDLCRSRPRDPWLFLADAISDQQKEAPLIDRLVGRNGLTPDGNVSLQLNIYGRVAQNRAPKRLATEGMLLKPKNVANYRALAAAGGDEKENANNKENDASANEAPAGAAAADASNEDGSNVGGEGKFINETQSLITQLISPNLRDFKMNEQFKIDEEMKKLYYEKIGSIQELETQFDLMLSISMLCALTASRSLKTPLYQYLASSAAEQAEIAALNAGIGMGSPDTVDAPRPAQVTFDDGTLQVPNIMCILTKSDSLPSIAAVFAEGIDAARRIGMFKQLSEVIAESVASGKKGKESEGKTRDEYSGAVLVNQPKNLNDLLTFVNDCVEKCKFEDFESGMVSYSIICGNSFRKFDSDTNKYTVYGEKKPMENSDLVSYYSKIVSDFSNVAYLEDPMDRSDTDGFTLLCAELNDKVTIVGNELYSGVSDKVETGLTQKWTHSVCVPVYYLFTITNTFEICRQIENLYAKTQSLIIDDTFDNNASQPCFIDLAVACRCAVIRLPLPTMSHANARYNRLLFLSDELTVSNEAALQDMNGAKPPNTLLPPTEEEAEALP